MAVLSPFLVLSTVVAFVAAQCNVAVKNVTSTELITTTFDDLEIVPCKPRRSTEPYNGLLFLNETNLPAPIHNTTSTATCHTSSSGSGPFGFYVSKPNSVEAELGVLRLVSPNGTTFNWRGATVMKKFDREVLRYDQDYLIVGRMRGYDACGERVATYTSAWQESNHEWMVPSDEEYLWDSVSNVTLSVWWWFQGAGDVPTSRVWYTYYDNFVYGTDLA